MVDGEALSKCIRLLQVMEETCNYELNSKSNKANMPTELLSVVKKGVPAFNVIEYAKTFLFKP